MEDAYFDGSTFFCGGCAPDVAIQVQDGGGEADFPVNCDSCGVPLENPLTSTGVLYVLEAIRASLRSGKAERDRIIPKPGTAQERLSYYSGSRQCEIVRDWANQIRSYRLSPREQRLVDLYLHITREVAA